MIVRGTTETRDELTGNFGSALEDTSISDYRLIALFAEKTLNAIFGVLQHYPPKPDVAAGRPCPFGADSVEKLENRGAPKISQT